MRALIVRSSRTPHVFSTWYRRAAGEGDFQNAS